MGDMPFGFPMGEFDPDDPEDRERLEKAISAVETTVEKVKGRRADYRRMAGEAQAISFRNFVDSLDDDQIETLANLMSGLAREGQNNYLTQYVAGILQGAVWSRKGIESESAIAAWSAIADMHENRGPDGE